MAKVWSRDVTAKFIAALKSQPSLWDANDTTYQNKKQRHTSLKEIYLEMLQHDPSVTIKYIRRKINSLRSQYRKELRGLETNIKRIDVKTNTIRPSLWCFEQLAFLRPHVRIKLPDSIIEKFSYEKSPEHINENEETRDDLELLNPYHNGGVIKLERKNNLKRKGNNSLQSQQRKHKLIQSQYKPESENDFDDENVDEETIETEPFENNMTVVNNSTEIYGKCWAAEYSKLDTTQQIYAKRAIDEVLYQGRLGNLTQESTEIQIVSNYIESI